MVYTLEKNSLRNKAIKAVNDTAFFPEKGKERLLSRLKEDRTGVFLGKESGSSFTNFYK